MKIEHFALQVADPIAMARWYVVRVYALALLVNLLLIGFFAVLVAIMNV